MKNYLLFFLLVIYCNGLSAQSGRDTLLIKKELDTLNRQIDQWVVQKNLNLLKKHYADDFVFTHGTGHIDSKTSWLKAVSDKNRQFVSRVHDSTAVELHNRLAIVTGTLTVQRNASGINNRYAVRYVRVYALQKKTWQMISHRTVLEWHL